MSTTIPNRVKNILPEEQGRVVLIDGAHFRDLSMTLALDKAMPYGEMKNELIESLIIVSEQERASYCTPWRMGHFRGL